MTIEKLTGYINAKKAQIEKLRAKAAKYDAEARRLAETDEDDDMWSVWDAQNAHLELEEAIASEEKYENLLKAEMAKEDVPEIAELRAFLDAWEARVMAWLRENAALYDRLESEYSQKAKAYSKLPYSETIAQRAQHERDYADYHRAVRESIAPIVATAAKGHDPQGHLRFDWEQIGSKVAEEKKNKYYRLVSDVTSITGKIVGTRSLSMGAKGDINGFVLGEKGTAHVETFGAGGEHAGQIVNVRRGPIFHFRTRVYADAASAPAQAETNPAAV